MQIRATARTLKLHGRRFVTPLIIPSFSSRAKPPDPVTDFLGGTLEAIGGPILISAYDVAHQPLEPKSDILNQIAGADLSFVLLDSGGYEVIWNRNAVNAGLIRGAAAPEWTRELYNDVLETWPKDVPLLAVSWDSDGTSIEHQIEAASALAARFPTHEIELLLKPPEEDLRVEQIISHVSTLQNFPVIGITEKEIGRSMAARLRFISELRQALDDFGSQVPIHVFGGLDPQMTPLYHMAGADIFDGLSWLRYAFHDDRGVYDKSFVAVHSPHDIEDDRIWEMRRNNVRHLVNLQIGMTRFQSSKDFTALGKSGELLRSAWEQCCRA